MARTPEQNNAIITGNIPRQLLLFFFPIWLGTMFQQLYNTVDTLIVGNFVGTQALAAVGATSSFVQLLVGLFVGLCSGAGVIIAQSFGAGDHDEVNRQVHTALALAIAGGAALTVIGLLISRPVLRLMQTPDEIVGMASEYLQIYFLGMIPQMIYNMGTNILRAVGDSKRPLYFLIVCALANTGLDLLFVAVFRLGTAGAAMATSLSQLICAGLVIWVLLRIPGDCRLHVSELRFDSVLLRRMTAIGLPAGLATIMYSVANVIIQKAINLLGTDTAAAWSIYWKLDGFYWPISNAIGIAVMTYVGQNFGAGDRERVHESIHKGLLIHLTTSALFSVIIFSGRYPMMHLFVGDDPTVIAIGAQVTALIAPCYVLFTLVEVLSATMRGVGDAVVPAAITMVFTCIVRLIYLWGYAFSHNSNLTIAVIYPISWVLTSIAFLLYYKSRKWMPKGFHF